MLGRKKTTTGSVDKEVSKGVGRTLGSLGLCLVVLALLGGWVYTGSYYVNEGEEAVVLRLGSYNRTETDAGFKVRFPPPFETMQKVKVSKIQQEEFLFYEIPVGEESGLEHFGPDGSRLYSNEQLCVRGIILLAHRLQYLLRGCGVYHIKDTTRYPIHVCYLSVLQLPLLLGIHLSFS